MKIKVTSPVVLQEMTKWWTNTDEDINEYDAKGLRSITRTVSVLEAMRTGTFIDEHVVYKSLKDLLVYWEDIAKDAISDWGIQIYQGERPPWESTENELGLEYALKQWTVVWAAEGIVNAIASHRVARNPLSVERLLFDTIIEWKGAK